MPDPSDKFGAFGTIRDLGHNRKLAGALGDMIVAWSDAERQLADIMHLLTRMSYPMTIDVLARMTTFESRTKIIKMLLENWAEPNHAASEVSKAIEGLSRLSQTRNDFVHASYVAPLDKSVTVIFDFREPAGKRRRSLRASDVLQHVKAVHARTDQLQKLVSALRPKSQK